MKQLKLQNVKMFRASTFRDNLYYDVIMKDLISSAPEVKTKSCSKKQLISFLSDGPRNTNSVQVVVWEQHHRLLNHYVTQVGTF